jgi:phosphoglycolate phosphatase
MAFRAYPYDACIFDLDGTLLNTLPDLVMLTNRALAEAGFPSRTQAEILSYVGNGARALMNQAVPQTADPAAVEEALARWKELYPEYGHKRTAPYPGIVDALKILKAHGLKLAVLSNKFDAATREVIDRYLPGIFQVVHGECDEIPRKPDPTGLLRTVRELDAIPARSVYIGDAPGDMLVARAAGTFALGVGWGYRSVEDLEKARANAVIADPAQIYDAVCGGVLS